MRDRLREARNEQGLTQQDMADKLGITLNGYQKIEYGERVGNVELWDRMEDMFGIHQRILRMNGESK